MLWIDQKTNYCWRMGMGMVVSDRCSTSIARSHDFESDVRGRRNSTRCTTHCNWRRSVQNHEGMDIRDVSCWTIILFFSRKIESEDKFATINTMKIVFTVKWNNCVTSWHFNKKKSVVAFCDAFSLKIFHSCFSIAHGM